MKPLRIILSKTSANVKSYYRETKWAYLFIEDDELLEKDNKELDCKPMQSEKFLKTKIRFYGGEAIDFHHKEVPKVGSNYTFQQQ